MQVPLDQVGLVEDEGESPIELLGRGRLPFQMTRRRRMFKVIDRSETVLNVFSIQ